MNHTALAARRFPLLGRPRPHCPPLPLRIQEITDAVDTATRKAEHGLHDAAHALNKAALVASDSGMTDLAEHLCWQHINAYRHLLRPLTILEARYMLEPVLNLARLHLRAQQGTLALTLLNAMYKAVTERGDLTVGHHLLPTSHLTGEHQERRQLREWVWLQLIGEGIRALALANRWNDAAEHARAHNGIGAHLMEGRQAAIIAHCLNDDHAYGRALLDQSTPTEPWEQDVAACLRIMCAQPTNPDSAHYVTATVTRLTARLSPSPGYASYNARLGLTIATLAASTSNTLATTLLREVAERAIASQDGYAARDVLGHREPASGITPYQRETLHQRAVDAGLGIGTIPDPYLQHLTSASRDAVAVLRIALASANTHAPSLRSSG